jgi:hypothetical protein
VAFEIVKLWLLPFVMVSFWLWLVPSWTVPKLKLDGLVVMPPDETPLPVSAIFSGVLDVSLAKARFPVTSPADWGPKTTLKVTPCPASKVMGRTNPVVLKPVPVTVSCETVRLEPPVFARLTDCAWVVPSSTLPKATLGGTELRTPGGCVLMFVLPELKPWQPTNVARASTTSSAFKRAGRWPIWVVLSPIHGDKVSLPDNYPLG